MPALRELNGRFLKYAPYADEWTEQRPDGLIVGVRGIRRAWREVEQLAEADGLSFLCPKCYAENGGPVGTHSVICWFKGKVPDDLAPGPGRWNPQGTGLDDLTFIGPGAYSIQLKGGCLWHGFVTEGKAE